MSPNLYKGQLIIFYVLLTRRAARSYERKSGKSLLPYKTKAGSDELDVFVIIIILCKNKFASAIERHSTFAT